MKDISELYGTGENLWTRNMMSYSEIGNRGWGGFLREECAGDICAFSSMDELTWLLTDERKNLFHKRYVFENSYVQTFIGLDIGEYVWKTFPRRNSMERGILEERQRRIEEENKPIELDDYE